MTEATIEEIQAHTPTNVRLVNLDGEEISVELAFENVEDGVFRYSIVLPERFQQEEFKSLLVDIFPGHSSISFPALAGMELDED